jgi:hypothetical protein
MEVVVVDAVVRLTKGVTHYRLALPKSESTDEETQKDIPVVVCVHGIDHVAHVWDFLAHHLGSLGITPLR